MVWFLLAEDHPNPTRPELNRIGLKLFEWNPEEKELVLVTKLTWPGFIKGRALSDPFAYPQVSAGAIVEYIKALERYFGEEGRAGSLGNLIYLVCMTGDKAKTTKDTSVNLMTGFTLVNHPEIRKTERNFFFRYTEVGGDEFTEEDAYNLLKFDEEDTDRLFKELNLVSDKEINVDEEAKED